MGSKKLLTVLRRRGGGGFVGPFDDLATNLEAAYSLRRLLSGYEGSAIRVRRSSDNAEADIGFDENGDLDTSALLAYCGVGNGAVSMWYDQSGSGRNQIESGAGSQPIIVSSGTVSVDGNGKPWLVFDGANSGFNECTWNPTPSTASIFCVINPTDSGTSTEILFSDYSAHAVPIWDSDDSSNTAFVGCGTPGFFVNGLPKTWVKRDDVYDDLIFGSSQLLEMNSVDLSDWDVFEISTYTSATRMTGKMQELVIYSSNVTAGPVRSAMNDYWGLF